MEYGAAIADAHDLTPIYARYNTGRHISENGRELAAKLEALSLAWPGGGFGELSIVGHSMGGLVSRSAIHYGLEAGHGWVEALQRVFLLGAPSRGAHLEQLTHIAAFTLESIWTPGTWLAGRALKLRSAGIKDLRHGFVRDEDWWDVDIDRLAFPAPLPTRAPDHTRWFVAAGRVGPPGSPLGRAFGDGLVRSTSAAGKSIDPRARERLEPAQFRVFDSTSHIALMHDPEVLEQILAWWT